MNRYAYERAAKHNNIPTEGEYIIKDLCLSRCKRSSNKHYVENSVAHKKKQYKVIRMKFIHKVIQINLHSFIHPKTVEHMTCFVHAVHVPAHGRMPNVSIQSHSNEIYN